MSAVHKRKHPEYELFRYDIRLDVMGDTLERELIDNFELIQADNNTQEIVWAFEVAHDALGARPFSKHCHVCWRVKKAVRSDRNLASFGTAKWFLKWQCPRAACKTSHRKIFFPSDRHFLGYIMKDGEYYGNVTPENAQLYKEAWWMHADERKRSADRMFCVTKDNMLNVARSTYWECHEDIEELKKKWSSETSKADVFDVMVYMTVQLDYDLKFLRATERLRVSAYCPNDWDACKSVITGFKDIMTVDRQVCDRWGTAIRKRKRGGT